MFVSAKILRSAPNAMFAGGEPVRFAPTDVSLLQGEMRGRTWCRDARCRPVLLFIGVSGVFLDGGALRFRSAGLSLIDHINSNLWLQFLSDLDRHHERADGTNRTR